MRQLPLCRRGDDLLCSPSCVVPFCSTFESVVFASGHWYLRNGVSLWSQMCDQELVPSQQCLRLG